MMESVRPNERQKRADVRPMSKESTKKIPQTCEY